MDIAVIVFNQLIIMAILIGVGIICGKTKLINLDGAKQFSNLLLNVVVPCVMFKSFMIPFENEKLITLGFACIFGFLAHFVCILIGSLVYKKSENPEYRVKRFALVFSNCGFMAIPVISAILGPEGVFYSAAFLIAGNVLTFSYGVCVLNSSEKNTVSSVLKKTVINPVIIAILIGFCVFVFQIPIPKPINASASFFESMNTPLAMVIMGVYICHCNLKQGFLNKKIYILSFLRLIVSPLIMICAFWLFDFLLPNIIDDKIIIANLVAAACPCAITTLILTAVYIGSEENRPVGNNPRDFALSCVVVTTILSLVTIPIMVLIGQICLS